MTDAEIDQLNAEMADGIIDEVGHVLGLLGCEHGKGSESTPPMMYPEMIACAVRHAFNEGRRFERERDQ